LKPIKELIELNWKNRETERERERERESGRDQDSKHYHFENTLAMFSVVLSQRSEPWIAY